MISAVLRRDIPGGKAISPTRTLVRTDGSPLEVGLDWGQGVAMGENAHPHFVLSKNDKLVLDALSAASGPVKAYDLLDRLKGEGVRAPMTVYRALTSLTEKGLVHKVDALNAFVVCTHPGEHQVQRLLICGECGDTVEARPVAMDDDITAMAQDMGFSAKLARLEIVGRCANCGSPE